MDSTDLAGDEPSRRRAEGRFLFLSCVIIAIAFAGYVDFRHLRGDELTEKRDIRALWEDGARIRRCENPYARTLGANPTANKKYATYFPLFYVLSAGSQLIAPSYPQYITLWRSIFFVFYAAIGLALAWPFHRRGQYLLGLFAVLFWLFNRWTLKSV